MFHVFLKLYFDWRCMFLPNIENLLQFNCGDDTVYRLHTKLNLEGGMHEVLSSNNPKGKASIYVHFLP